MPLFPASEGSDFCGRAVRSLFSLRHINASTKYVAAPDESHQSPLTGAHHDGEYVPTYSTLVVAEQWMHGMALRKEDGHFTSGFIFFL